MVDARKWTELTPKEKSERMRAGKEAKAAARQAAIEERAQTALDVAQAIIAEPEPLPQPEPDIIPEPVSDPGEREAEDGFQMFLDGLDAETREALDEDELLAVYAQAKAKVAADRKAALKKRALERAIEAEQIAAGIIPTASAERKAEEKRLAEMVTVNIDLPEGGNPVILMDQHAYHHGQQYTVTRATAECINEMMFRTWQHEAMFIGKSRGYFTHRLAMAQGSQPWIIGGGHA